MERAAQLCERQQRYFKENENRQYKSSILERSAINPCITAIRDAKDKLQHPKTEKADEEQEYPNWVDEGNKQLWFGVPESIRSGIDKYVTQGIYPGVFLMAIFENDLAKTISISAGLNYLHIAEITRFSHCAMPGLSVGDTKRVANWIENGGLGGTNIPYLQKMSTEELKQELFATGKSSPFKGTTTGKLMIRAGEIIGSLDEQI